MIKLRKLKRIDIQRVIKDPNWQEFRISLKGLTTEEKMDKLQFWLDELGFELGFSLEDSEILVINYINALKRGGLFNK